MPFRIATFLTASAVAAGLARWFFGWPYVGWGAWIGALLWLALDAWRAGRLLGVLRQGGVGLPARGACGAPTSRRSPSTCCSTPIDGRSTTPRAAGQGSNAGGPARPSVG